MPSASPMAASRGDVLRTRDKQTPVGAAVLTQRELSLAVAVGSSSSNDDSDAVAGTSQPAEKDWTSTKNYQFLPYGTATCKDTLGLVLRVGHCTTQEESKAAGST